MGMPGRKFSAVSAYRYGFNGKENDNEVKGEGNQQDYGMRVYESRIGRFLSVDPLTRKFAMLTPYQFASNRPIDGIDLDGLEWTLGQLKQLKEQARTFLRKLSSEEGMIFTRGAANALGNANSFGLSDNLPEWTGLATDNLGDYDTQYEQQIYLWGRIFGDVGALVQSANEVSGGLGTAAAGSGTVAVGIGGLAVAGHGTGVGAAATYDFSWAVGKLKDLGVTVQASSDGSSSTNDGTNNQTNSAHGSGNASNSNSSTSPNPYLKQTKDQNLSTKEKLEKLVKEHKEKIEKFKKDPLGQSSEEWLREASKDSPLTETLLERAMGRIPALEKQLKKQEGELQKVNEALKTQ